MMYFQDISVAIGSLAILVVCLQVLGIYTCICIGTVLFIVLINHKRLPILFQVLPRELKFIVLVVKQMLKMKMLEKQKLVEIFEKTVNKYPNKIAIIDAENGKKLTFKKFLETSRKLSNIFHDHGCKKGDKVALFLNNCVEYIPLILGLSELGCISVLINRNLKGSSLKNSLELSESSAIVFDVELKDCLNKIGYFENTQHNKYFAIGMSEIDHHYDLENEVNDIKNLDQILKDACSDFISSIPVNVDFPVSYIFTSGTSGFPKPAIMPRKKYLAGFLIFEALTRVQHNDIVYNTLPMYHTSGSIIFFAPTFMKGCTMVIRKKFSNHKFFEDAAKYQVTYAGYIGEMWRYLLLKPQNKALEQGHCIKKIVGNGMRRSFFPIVRDRFKISEIYEFYGATEANMGFINFDNEPGAVGFVFKCFSFLNFKRLVKVDQDTGELLRGADGLSIECQPGEIGTMVGIINKNQPYYGYAVRNGEESNKKIESDVFQKGDKVFLSGDLLVTDDRGYLYFVDRIGDTFRWKGENVSTTEVENVFSAATTSRLSNVVVYPVQIPNKEGTAGMAYIQLDKNETLDITKLTENVKKNLPYYAVPIFLKVGHEIETTGTYKYMKTTLKQQGFDQAYLSEDEVLYIFDPREKSYKIFEEKEFNDILREY